MLAFETRAVGWNRHLLVQCREEAHCKMQVLDLGIGQCQYTTLAATILTVFVDLDMNICNHLCTLEVQVPNSSLEVWLGRSVLQSACGDQAIKNCKAIFQDGDFVLQTCEYSMIQMLKPSVRPWNWSRLFCNSALAAKD